MKKIMLIFASVFALSQPLLAQNEVKDSVPTVTSQPASPLSAGNLLFNYQKETKYLGMKLSGCGPVLSGQKYGYWEFSLGYGFGSYEQLNLGVGYGLGTAGRLGDYFVLTAAAYPYAGISSYDYDDIKISPSGSINSEKKNKFDLTYGVNAYVTAGLKVFTLKKSHEEIYLSVGYGWSAPKFKFENFFDNGGWMFGITFTEL